MAKGPRTHLQQLKQLLHVLRTNVRKTNAAPQHHVGFLLSLHLTATITLMLLLAGAFWVYSKVVILMPVPLYMSRGE